MKRGSKLNIPPKCLIGPIGYFPFVDPESDPPNLGEVGCEERLGGLLGHYYWKAD